MEIFYAILWYLIGVGSTLYGGFRKNNELTNRDLVIALTLGGLLGVITFIVLSVIILDESNWLDKKVYKNK